MSNQNAEVVSVRIIPNTKGSPRGSSRTRSDLRSRIWSAQRTEAHRLLGLGTPQRQGRNVTFPARQHAVNGERRSFALLRPANGDLSAQEAVRDLILEAHSASEAQAD